VISSTKEKEHKPMAAPAGNTNAKKKGRTRVNFSISLADSRLAAIIQHLEAQGIEATDHAIQDFAKREAYAGIDAKVAEKQFSASSKTRLKKT
jgi:hypothetical protein